MLKIRGIHTFLGEWYGHPVEVIILYIYIYIYIYSCDFVEDHKGRESSNSFGGFQGSPKPQPVPLTGPDRPPGPLVTLLDLWGWPQRVSALRLFAPRGPWAMSSGSMQRWRLECLCKRKWSSKVGYLKWKNSHWYLFLLDEHPLQTFLHQVLLLAKKPTLPRSCGVSYSATSVVHQKFWTFPGEALSEERTIPSAWSGNRPAWLLSKSSGTANDPQLVVWSTLLQQWFSIPHSWGPPVYWPSHINFYSLWSRELWGRSAMTFRDIATWTWG